jgi:hypothetical protein
MAQDSRVTANLIQKKWDNTLRRAVEASDIFSNFRGDVIGEGSLPGTIIAVKKQNGGATTLSMGLTKALSSAPIVGRSALAGSEQKLEILDFTACANEVKQGTNVDTFGIDAVGNKPYKVVEEAVKQLGMYMEKVKGLHRREALIQRYSSNLVVAPTSKVQHYNSNFYVGGVAFSEQPEYSDTLATYVANIVSAIPDTEVAANQMNFDGVRNLEKWAKTQKKIKPLANGKYVVTVPTNQMYTLMSEKDGLGGVFNQSGEPSMALRNWVGEWSSLMFVEDIRSPAILATSATLAVTYTSVDDSRPVAGAGIWDVSFLLGADAVLELELEPINMREDKSIEYGREGRTGAFTTYGDQIIEYSDGTDVMNNYGSAVALFASEV